MTATAEILTIGDELTSGEIVDTNATFFAERLSDLGWRVTWMTSCTDDAADIRAALTLAAGRTQLVVVSGGLGPTEDDRTVDAVCVLLGVPAEIDPGARAFMERRFAESGFALTPNNLRQ